jgi:uncharacterized protein involved in exopolysaccharide biosynthesis
MSDPVLQVLDVSQKLHDLRQRLDQLNAERAAVEAQIAACMQQLASTASSQVMPPPGTGLTQQIIWVLRKYPDHAMAPMDIAQVLNMTSRQQLTNVRVRMSRMWREGRVRRVGHARYLAIQ